MKTRKELIAEVEELARDLGEEVSTDRMNNAALGELAASLRARLEARTQPAAPPLPGAQPAPAPERTEDEQTPPSRLVAPADPPKPPRVDGSADAAEGGPPPPKVEQPKPPRAPYYVAAGRSIVANGRVLGPFKPVKASDFPGGQKDLDYFVMRGAVVRS